MEFIDRMGCHTYEGPPCGNKKCHKMLALQKTRTISCHMFNSHVTINTPRYAVPSLYTNVPQLMRYHQRLPHSPTGVCQPVDEWVADEVICSKIVRFIFSLINRPVTLNIYNKYIHQQLFKKSTAMFRSMT